MMDNIIETITPYVEEATQMVVDKDDLKKAIMNYYGNRMTGDEYQALASRTINGELNGMQLVLHSLHGMSGEVGEIHSIYQKKYQGHIEENEQEHLMKEVGDLLWFIAEFCTVQGFSLEDVMKMNIDKLKARFPEGFEVERSVNRQEGDI